MRDERLTSLDLPPGRLDTSGWRDGGSIRYRASPPVPIHPAVARYRLSPGDLPQAGRRKSNL